ncbi:hypothetical protein [Peribacillus acanthi]|uniref:hypothetical protein n=1 Tax=Peribacillus acanthi TaxID=2171554 RepID=UPI000D3E67F3|nr:hypothetical protein [Peribacillus acanthi]
MKTIIFALIGSLFIHIIYIFTPIFIGFVQTKSYFPKVTQDYESVHSLQNEVAFGRTVEMNYFYLGVSFVVVTIILWWIIKIVNRLSRKSL